MSYDIWIETADGSVTPDEWIGFGQGPTGTVVLTADGSHGFCGSYTSNVSGMWSKALLAVGGRPLEKLRDSHGRNCGEIADQLIQAGQYIATHADVFEPMNPDNDWGDYLGAAGYLASIGHACSQHPDATVAVSS